MKQIKRENGAEPTEERGALKTVHIDQFWVIGNLCDRFCVTCCVRYVWERFKLVKRQSS